VAILVAADFDAAGWALWCRLLREALPDERLLRADDPSDAAAFSAEAAAIDVAVVANPKPGSLHGLPRLRFVQSLWAGVDRLLAPAAGLLPDDVLLARMVDPAMNAAMAETALWAVLGLHRGLLQCVHRQRDAVWADPLPLRRADEVRVAVLGAGQMGRTVAARLVQQGYRVGAWRRGAAVDATVDAPGAATSVDLHHGADGLATLLAGAHIVVSLLPLTPATDGLLDARCLAGLPRGACVVNLGRGAHVVDADLLAALDCGQLRHAVLDVFNVEPLPPSHRYWSHPAVTVLPHIAAPTDPRSAVGVVAANIARYRAGHAPLHLVDRTRGY
jgi:glyoxylate/hydroxypyruvate reductase